MSDIENTFLDEIKEPVWPDSEFHSIGVGVKFFESEGILGITSDNYNDLRVDKFILSLYGNCKPPQSLISKLFRKKAITLNGKKANIFDNVGYGDAIFLSKGFLEKFPLTDTRKVSSTHSGISQQSLEAFEANWIHEDDDIAILNKPYSLAVQGGTKIKYSVVDYLKMIDPEYRIVHRLDKNTTGCLVIAKNRPSSVKLGKELSNRNITKEYLAIVNGIPDRAEDTINSPIAKNYSLRKMKTKTGNYEDDCMDEDSDYKEASTSYKVIASFESEAHGALSLLRVSIKTGRTHQIRIHLSSIRAPILGDDLYNMREVSAHKPKMMLHAYSITLNEKEFTCPMPQHFKDVINADTLASITLKTA